MEALPHAVRELLQRPNVAHVATLLPDGAPHVAATWIGVEDGRPVFFTEPGSRKARNLDADPRLSVSVADHKNPLRMTHLRGRVAERLEGDDAWPIIDRLSHVYQGGPYPRDMELVVYVVAVERAIAHDYS